MNLLNLGWYGHNNVGDESYKHSFAEVFPDHNFTFTDYITKAQLAECDAVILGGGNVMKPSFLEQLKNINKPIFGVSVGFESDVMVDVKFNHIFARENHSVQKLTEMGLSCSYMPDLAFALTGDAKRGRDLLQTRFDKDNLELYEKVIVIVINSYLIQGDLDGFSRNAIRFLNFSYEMAKIIDETCASFVFVPFGTEHSSDDRVANSWIAEKCRWWKKNYVFHDRLDHQAVLDIIACSDTVISSRLHSSIFAYSCGVPLVDITHHNKNFYFLDSIDSKKDSVSYWSFDAESAHSKIKSYLNYPKHDKAELLRMKLKETSNAIRFSE